MTEETHNAAMSGSIGIVMAIGVSAVLVSSVDSAISAVFFFVCTDVSFLVLGMVPPSRPSVLDTRL